MKKERGKGEEPAEALAEGGGGFSKNYNRKETREGRRSDTRKLGDYKR